MNEKDKKAGTMWLITQQNLSLQGQNNDIIQPPNNFFRKMGRNEICEALGGIIFPTTFGCTKFQNNNLWSRASLSVENFYFSIDNPVSDEVASYTAVTEAGRAHRQHEFDQSMPKVE